MIEYSDSAKLKIANFLKYRNDIDIYTEDDQSDREFYKVLFNRLVDSKIKISDVFPLGGKQQVIAAFNEYKIQADKTRKKIFIVDGDLDLILGTNPENEKYFYVLQAYCIENFLFDKNASCKLTFYNHGTQSLEECEKQFDFENWVGLNLNTLIELFKNLALLKEVGGSPEIKHLTSFLKMVGKERVLDKEKVAIYIDQLRDDILEKLKPIDPSPEKYYVRRIKEISIRWTEDINTFLSIVSGKDYLLPLLQFRINFIAGKSSLFPNRNLKIFLADHCSLERLDGLREVIMN